MSLTYHPLANLFPLMEGQDFADLVADIAAHGLREPVIVHEGQILDGRNRYRACEKAGVPVRLVPYDGEDAVAFVVSLNLRRRHLTESQRAMVAGKLANLSAGANQHTAGRANLPDLIEARQPAPPPVSVARAADMLNVSERSVKAARAVVDHGVPELVQKVEAGEVSVSAAADVARMPEPEQREVVARGEREILEAAKRIRAERAVVSREARIEKIAEIAKGNAPLAVAAKFPVIYADPPWRYENPPMGATNRKEWVSEFPTIRADNGRYITTSVAVPRDELMKRIGEAMFVSWAPEDDAA